LATSAADDMLMMMLAGRGRGGGNPGRGGYRDGYDGGYGGGYQGDSHPRGADGGYRPGRGGYEYQDAGGYRRRGGGAGGGAGGGGGSGGGDYGGRPRRDSDNRRQPDLNLREPSPGQRCGVFPLWFSAPVGVLELQGVLWCCNYAGV